MFQYKRTTAGFGSRVAARQPSNSTMPAWQVAALGYLFGTAFILTMTL